MFMMRVRCSCVCGCLACVCAVIVCALVVCDACACVNYCACDALEF